MMRRRSQCQCRAHPETVPRAKLCLRLKAGVLGAPQVRPADSMISSAQSCHTGAIPAVSAMPDMLNAQQVQASWGACWIRLTWSGACAAPPCRCWDQHVVELQARQHWWSAVPALAVGWLGYVPYTIISLSSSGVQPQSGVEHVMHGRSKGPGRAGWPAMHVCMALQLCMTHPAWHQAAVC